MPSAIEVVIGAGQSGLAAASTPVTAVQAHDQAGFLVHTATGRPCTPRV